MTANIFIFTEEVDSALLISAKALKFKPDASMEKQFKIIPDSAGERQAQHAARKAATNNPLAPPRISMTRPAGWSIRPQPPEHRPLSGSGRVIA